MSPSSALRALRALAVLAFAAAAAAAPDPAGLPADLFTSRALRQMPKMLQKALSASAPAAASADDTRRSLAESTVCAGT
jgi:hypothetical protein